MSDRLKALAAEGTSPWLDNIRRGWLRSGEFARMVEDGILGVTSNPTIFQKAIADSDDYDEAVRTVWPGEPDRPRRSSSSWRSRTCTRPATRSARSTTTPATWTASSRSSCLRTWRTTRPVRGGGPRSLEADRPAEPVHQDPGHGRGRPGHRGVDRRRDQRQRHAAVLARAPRRGHSGLHPRARAPGGAGLPIDDVHSVASFFVSRVDTDIDAQLPDDSRRCRARRRSPRPSSPTSSTWASPAPTLVGTGRPRRAGPAPAVGLDGTKNPAYPDLLYVDP